MKLTVCVYSIRLVPVNSGLLENSQESAFFQVLIAMERNRHGVLSVIVVVYVVAAFYAIQIIPVLFQDFNHPFWRQVHLRVCMALGNLHAE